MKIVVAVCAAGLLVSSTESARAEFVFLPGGARTISRGDSASRDTPVLELAYGPRAQASIGTDLGFFAIASPSATLHLGGYAMIALHNGVSDAAFPPFENWRGPRRSFSASAPAGRARAQVVFGRRGALELTLVAGHESDHHTDGPPPVVRRPDESSRTRRATSSRPRSRGGSWSARSASRRASSIARTSGGASPTCPRPTSTCSSSCKYPIVQPRLALYGEALAPRDTGIRLGFFARAMLGVTFVGRYAEVTPFVSFDVLRGQRSGRAHVSTRGARVLRSPLW